MKIFLLSIFLPLSANASLPVLTCHNGATGADLSLGYYADHTYFLANGVLEDALARQGVRDLGKTGGDRATIRRDGGFSFSAPLSHNGVMNVVRDNSGGYLVRVLQIGVDANFYFNGGECRE